MPRSFKKKRKNWMLLGMKIPIYHWACGLFKDSYLQVLSRYLWEICRTLELVLTLRTRAGEGEIELSSEEYVQIIKEVTQLYRRIMWILSISATRTFEEMLDFQILFWVTIISRRHLKLMMEILSELTSLSKVVKVSVIAGAEMFLGSELHTRI